MNPAGPRRRRRRPPAAWRKSAGCAGAHHPWVISTRTADRLLAAARAQIVADWEIERPQMTAELLAQLSTLEQGGRDSGALGVALGCINARARLAGLL